MITLQIYEISPLDVTIRTQSPAVRKKILCLETLPLLPMPGVEMPYLPSAPRLHPPFRPFYTSAEL